MGEATFVSGEAGHILGAVLHTRFEGIEGGAELAAEDSELIPGAGDLASD